MYVLFCIAIISFVVLCVYIACTCLRKSVGITFSVNYYTQKMIIQQETSVLTKVLRWDYSSANSQTESKHVTTGCDIVLYAGPQESKLVFGQDYQ